jgi:hypothetical protein
VFIVVSLSLGALRHAAAEREKWLMDLVAQDWPRFTPGFH